MKACLHVRRLPSANATFPELYQSAGDGVLVVREVKGRSVVTAGEAWQHVAQGRHPQRNVSSRDIHVRRLLYMSST
jgi:hypothetical protein